MSLFAAQYNAQYLPDSDIAKPLGWFLDYLGFRESGSGVKVTPDTAISLSTVFNAGLLLSETLAQLPVAPYEVRISADRERRRVARDHVTYRLVAKEPNEYMTSHTFRKVMMVNAFKYDRAYAVIERDRFGDPISMYPVPSPWVQMKLINGSITYIVKNWWNNGQEERLGEMDVLHIIGYTDNGLEGVSRIRILSDSLGNAIAAERFTGAFFGKGVNVSGFIKTQKLLKTADAVKRLKESFVKQVSGKDNQFGVGLLEDGAEWIPNETDPQKAQLNETRKVNGLTVAQMWNIPLPMLKQMDRGTYSSMEQLDIQFSKYTMTPWIVNWEQEMERKLLTEREKQSGRYYYHFNQNALLRADAASRGKFYESMTKTGAFTPNDINELEDRDTFDGGDVHVIPSGYQTLESLKNA
jgi:HK97 family phage portal protein